MTTLNMLEPVGDMVSLIGSPEFGHDFYRIVDGMIGIDHCTVFIHRDSTPQIVVAEAQSVPTANKVRSLAHRYISDGFHNDPVWENCGSGRECNAFVLSPKQLVHDAYRQEFYVKPNIKHELVLTALINGDRIYAGFYREHGSADFSADAVDIVKQCGRAISQVLQKHGEVTRGSAITAMQPREISQKELLSRVRSAIRADSGALTAREAEICASIVLGYTVLGIGLNLGISINTVATHRKRAYAKLRVSSQNELFARYFSTVESNIHQLQKN